jgi:serine/threonine protein kinase
MERETFGRYELIERIDVGGMAEVFKAVQRGVAGFERPVAIKRILPSIAADPDIVRMFVEEAKLAVQLSHPAIAQVFDLGREGQDDDAGWFIAMEYIDGQSLLALWERFTARQERIPIGAVCHLIERIADALDHAHFAVDARGRPLGIIHRDVSPGNVLVSFDGEVKLIDFGLAKAKNRVSQTRDGIVKGKLAYLSPEQAHGQPIDHRSDLFSLGVCFWELLTGRRAFKRDDDRETVLAIRRGVVDRPSRHATVPPALERIVMRALAVDPEQRYATGRELADDVAAYQRRAGLAFGPGDMAALMGDTFTAEPIALVREKRPPDTSEEELEEVTDPIIPLVPSEATASDTVPNIELPARRR